MTLDDLDQALRLSTVVGWNQTLDDWRMLLQLAPTGTFAAHVERRRASDVSIVGTAMGIDYGGFAWIAMMLVDPAWRGRGLGRRLLEAAMDAVPSHLPIRLDATPLGRPLYQRYGFEDEATLSRHVRDAQHVVDATRADAPDASGRRAPFVRPLVDADLATVIDQDRETFGGTRSAVIEWAFRSAPQYAYAVAGDNGAINYCLGRRGRSFDQIGPVVAGDDHTAHALVSAALAAAGDTPVVVDAFDSHDAFASELRDDGFVVQRPLVRMCRRANLVPLQGVSQEFAIFGPEFA